MVDQVLGRTVPTGVFIGFKGVIFSPGVEVGVIGQFHFDRSVDRNKIVPHPVPPAFRLLSRYRQTISSRFVESQKGPAFVHLDVVQVIRVHLEFYGTAGGIEEGRLGHHVDEPSHVAGKVLGWGWALHDLHGLQRAKGRGHFVSLEGSQHSVEIDASLPTAQDRSPGDAVKVVALRAGPDFVQVVKIVDLELFDGLRRKNQNRSRNIHKIHVG